LINLKIYKRMKNKKLAQKAFKSCLFLTLFLLLAAFTAKGQTWTNYFGPASTNDVAVDSQGVKWFARTNGVAKLNGTDWTYYDKLNSGLVSGYITSVAIDAQDKKWFCTYGNGVCTFDNTRWITYNTANSGLVGNFVHKVVIDKKGNKWFATNEGISKFNGTTWTTYNSSTVQGLTTTNGIREIAIDTFGNKWFSDRLNGLIKFNDTIWTTHQRDRNDVYIGSLSSLVADGKGNVWFSNQIGSISKFDGAIVLKYELPNMGIFANYIGKIVIDAQNNKWVSTQNNGLSKFNDTTWTIYNEANSGLPSDGVGPIALDRQNNKWFCYYISDNSANAGVVKFDGTNWTDYRFGNVQLAGSEIRSIFVDERNHKWIGTLVDLAKFDDVSWTNYSISVSKCSFVQDIEMDAQGNKWFSNANFSPTKFDGTTWKNYGNNGLLNSGKAIAVDAQNNKWFSDGGRGVCVFNDTTCQFYNSTNGLANSAVADIAVDAQNIKWFATYGGISKLEGTTWTTYNRTNSGLISEKVNCVAIDKEGNKWFGTAEGVSKFDGTNWKTYIPAASIFQYNRVYAIAIDAQNTKWFGTYRGLYKLQDTTLTLYTPMNSGLPDERVYAIAVDAWGNKWIGTSSGLSKFSETVPITTPANDSCQNAFVIPKLNFVSGTTAKATSETNVNRILSCETNQNVKDVWYKFRSDTGALRGFVVRLKVSNVSAAPLKYIVYKGSCNEFASISACKSVAANQQQTDTLRLLEANQDYFVRVWAIDSSQTANFTVQIHAVQNFSSTPLGQVNTTTVCQPFSSVNVNNTNSQKWISMIDTTGSIVAEINPNGNLLGLTTGGYFINSSGTIRRASGIPYLDRNIGIKVTNQPTTDVSIRLYFTERERAAYFATVGVNPIAVTHYAGALCLGNVQSGSGDLLPAVVRNTPNGNYYVEFNTRRFSGFFIGPNNSLVFSKELNAESDKLRIETAYPTPVTNELVVIFMAVQRAEKGKISITNVLGKVVLDKALTIESGQNDLKIDASTLANGLYFITLTNGQQQVVKRFVKQ
jgi:ligand-binding sensor domain-containing protein